MADLSRIRVAWSGPGVVGPGVSTFYVDHAIQVLDPADFVAFFTAIQGGFHTDVTWTIPGSGDTINDATGDLTGTWTASGGATVSGISAVSYALGVGARIVWQTGGIVGGRRSKGTTFLVPLVTSNYSNAGQLNDAARSTFASAGTSLISNTANALKIWSRPTPSRAGSSHVVTSASCPDLVSWLRTRKT